MKKIITIIVISIAFIACNSNQKKAEKLVNAHLNEYLLDIGSYQNIKMDELKEISLLGLFIQDDLRKVKMKELSTNDIGQRAGDFRKSLEQKNINPDSIIAFTMEHKYRAKNSFGAYIIEHVKYTFDDKLENIIATEEIE